MTKTAEAKIGHNNPPTLEEELRTRHPALFIELSALKRRYARLNLTPETEDEANKLGAFVVDARAYLKKVDGIRTKEKEPHLVASRTVDNLFNSELRDVLNPLATTAGDNAATFLARLAETRRQAAAAEAAKATAAAAKLQERAAVAESKGKTVEADILNNQAGAVQHQANIADVRANASDRDLSRTGNVGSLKSASASMTDIVEGFTRDTVDLNALRPFLKEEAILAAAKMALALGTKVTGVVYGQKAKGSFR